MARKNAEEMDATMLEEEDASEPRIYELSFHLDPELSEGEAKRIYESLLEAVRGAGTLIAEGAPEKIQLAYTISRTETAGRRDYDSAYFSWIAYEADGKGHETVASAARAEKRIIRFLDIRTTKELAQHSAELRELRAKAPEKEGGEDKVSDTELNAALDEVAA